MELIEKLPKKYEYGRPVYTGTFLCPECEAAVVRTLGNGQAAKTCGCNYSSVKDRQKQVLSATMRSITHAREQSKVTHAADKGRWKQPKKRK